MIRAEAQGRASVLRARGPKRAPHIRRFTGRPFDVVPQRYSKDLVVSREPRRPAGSWPAVGRSTSNRGCDAEGIYPGNTLF